MSIVVEKVSKKYEHQTVVKELSFSISSKKIVGFLGPNGAGKSTTMKMISGFIQPDEGNISIAGINVLRQPLQAQKKIGYLPEQNPLYTDFYIKEYLEFIARTYQLSSPKKRIDEVVAMVGLQNEVSKKIEQLSKGYKQRVGIASVLLHNPEVLILDEATSGLDPIQVVEIRQLIKQLGQEKTILFSTHILQEVEALCEDVIIINKGNLIANDSLLAIQTKYASTRIVASFRKNLQQKDFLPLMQFCKTIYFYNHQWHFDPKNIDEAKQHIIQFANNNNWELDSIFHQPNSLEHIFTDLATKQLTV